jgi:hypothetical protein
MIQLNHSPFIQHLFTLRICHLVTNQYLVFFLPTLFHIKLKKTKQYGNW